ncbi:hypothetical protein MRB53_006447 [Persea americana]|uniref:Uncharacterized protein n=1 Tax=Persea americana TaxID=3435 RepID=A0ACC2MH72_PERAE|nr:hypothetical protein MRB53_006447 [Persea americana]
MLLHIPDRREQHQRARYHLLCSHRCQLLQGRLHHLHKGAHASGQHPLALVGQRGVADQEAEICCSPTLPPCQISSAS